MPELPEVETIKRDIERSLIGHKIEDVWWDWAKSLKPDPESFKKAVLGKKFTAIDRRAKLLIFKLDGPPATARHERAGVPFITHLKLSGRLLYRNQTDPADQFTHVILKLDKGKELRFADMRKFGWMRVLKDEGELDEVLSEFGIEPFTPDFTLESFKKILNSKKTAIKPLLMDQSMIAGVGNIYADESLWCAEIHPEMPANKLSNDQVAKLFDCVQKVLKEGIKDRGTSVDMYLDLFGEKGEHEQNLQVFRKNGKPCPRCGSIIKKIRVGGRGTHFCPNCQQLG